MEISIDAKTKRYVSILLYFCLIAGAVILCFNSLPNRIIALSLFAVFAALRLYHHRLYCKAALTRTGRFALIAIESVLALCIQYLDRTAFSGFAVYLMIATVLLAYGPRLSIPLAAIAIAANIAILYLSSADALQNFWQTISTMLLPRLFIVATLSIASYNIALSGKNRQLAESLQQKTCELEIALSKLKAYADDLKETADLRARDKLMRDLHDTLGHTLATASISAQAAAVLMEKDASMAKARLAAVTQQIQVAMQSLRDVLSGKTIDYAEDALTPAQFLSLIRETQMRTEIPIHVRMFAAEEYSALPVSCRSFLYNALMEGLTNGMRHGATTRFEVSLAKVDSRIYFTLSDNGKGFQKLSFGYGLTKISRDAQRLGGQLTIAGRNGCEMQIVLPVRNGKEAEEFPNG